jgi:NADH dehydrogenase FAD-containing subunit
MSAARTGVDTARRSVLVDTADRDGVPVAYDYLVLATGVRHSYFGHDEFEKFAPGLKSLADAVGIRNRILRAFERAEAAEDPQAHPDLLTFVLVGAGPTGVEMAGAPFCYSDKGSMAVVGKGFAVPQSGKARASGGLVWLVWLAVHLWALAQPSLRLSVFVQWMWTLVSGQRGSRLIVNHGAPEPRVHAEAAVTRAPRSEAKSDSPIAAARSGTLTPASDA